MDLVQFAQQLKQQVAIEQLVGDYVSTLRQSGRSYKGRCPFHEEKTPSFFVNPEFRSFRCFGCNARGDVISFVQQIEKVDFPLAVEMIARRFGVAIPEFAGGKSREERDAAAERRATLLEACRAAEDYFVKQLSAHPKGADARAYLENRGLTPEHIRDYRIGFAPPGYENLIAEAERRGFNPATLAEAGLARQGQRGGYHDYFRDRIIFPIADRRGDTVAFGGRVLDDEQPKYLNSPDTPLFHKGKLLFGLSTSREAIRDAGQVIVLEGYMDWIALHSQGIENVTAGLGTALTEDQARLIRQMTQTEVILHYDGDVAGRKAAFEASRLILSQGLSVRVAPLPEGDDPDSFVRSRGPAATRGLIEEALPAIDHFLDEALGVHPATTPEGTVRIAERMAPLILALGEPVLQESYINRVSSRLGIKPETFIQSLRRGRKRSRPRAEEAPPIPEGEGPETESGPAIAPDRQECYLLSILLRNVDRAELFEGLGPELFTNEDLKSIFSIVHTAAKEVQEGASPPADWFTICQSERDILTLDVILNFESTLAGGGLREDEVRLESDSVVELCRTLARRLKRKHLRRSRRRAGLEMPRESSSYEHHRDSLSAIHSHSDSLARETEILLDREDSDA